MGDDAGAGVLCSTDTDNGNHCHPLSIPNGNASGGFTEATYVLEDGGTGHTHTVSISAYDVHDLEAGFTVMLLSTEDAGHSHQCRITCPT